MLLCSMIGSGCYLINKDLHLRLLMYYTHVKSWRYINIQAQYLDWFIDVHAEGWLKDFSIYMFLVLFNLVLKCDANESCGCGNNKAQFDLQQEKNIFEKIRPSE